MKIGFLKMRTQKTAEMKSTTNLTEVIARRLKRSLRVVVQMKMTRRFDGKSFERSWVKSRRLL